RKEAKEIINILEKTNPREIAEEMKKENKITLKTESGTLDLSEESISIEKEILLRGRAVDVETINKSIVVIEK
ncbi:MAG: hypothetical protein DRN18_03015, partial [Thermoplasmata archaeon]